MEQWTVLGLAAILWPLLAALSWWVFQMPGRERTRSLLLLASGGITGIGLVILFAWPAVLHGESEIPLMILLCGRNMWFQYAVAAPLGALIAYFLFQTTETHR
jgi:hypothetical protein